MITQFNIVSKVNKPLNKERQRRIFEEELFPHMDALKTFAFHLSYNEEDANDLVQETYLCEEFEKRVPGTGYRG